MKFNLGHYLFISIVLHGAIVCGLGTGSVHARATINLSNDVTGALVSFVANQTASIDPVIPVLPEDKSHKTDNIEELVVPTRSEEAAQKLVDAPMARLSRPSREVLKHEVQRAPKIVNKIDDSNSLNSISRAPILAGMGAGDINKVRVISAPKPPYPPRALKLGFEGAVSLKLRIARDGDVIDAQVEKSSGRTDCDVSAVNTALKYWRFSPATRAGHPIESTEQVVVVYKIER